MKCSNLIFSILFVVFFTSSKAGDFQFKTGDIVFQGYEGTQGFAIQLATNSVYNHVGIIIMKENQPYVFEAVEPVKYTPVDEWAKRGNGGHYVVKRLSGADSLINTTVIEKMKAFAKIAENKHYDIFFEWDDSKLYCSELVWKIYYECAGIKLGNLKALKEYKLSNPIVQNKLKERYGKNIPYDQKMIAPSDIFNYIGLVTVNER